MIPLSFTRKIAASQLVDRVTTCVENLEMSNDLTAAREKLGNCQGRNLVRERCLLLNLCLGQHQYLLA